ncbi:MAG: HAD family hydrolase [Rhodospirillaceae bacterium]|nr:HAD family hydrolase [Rhodospirillaceae bacterium]
MNARQHRLPQLIIFDCDGVLVDSEPIAAKVLADFITERGRPTDSQECLAEFTGLSIERVGEIIRSDWGVELEPDFVELLRPLDRAAFKAHLKPLPGARDTIARLQSAGIKVCVASSGRPEKIHYSLSITGLLDLFEGHLFSAVVVRHGKPAPDLFLFAAAQMDVAPAQCCVIEDSIAGVKAAKSAAMQVMAFCGGSHADDAHQQKLAAAAPDRLFDELAELPRLIGLS